jgi:hypothetical protein
MADSTFATFDSVSSLTFQDYLVGYRGIRETQINYTDFLKNTLQADLSSKQLISVYSTVNSLSDTWEESVFITPLQVASASWDSVYSTVNSLSDTWEESVYITPLQVASASWDSVYSTVNSISSIIPNPATTISPQIAVGITALSSINFLNTLSAQLLYTVPAGKIFLVTDYSIIIDAVVGGSVSDSSLPTFRLYRHDTLTNGANQVTNSLTPVTASNTITINRYYRIGGSVTESDGKALVSGDDASPQNKIWFRVDSLGTNSYTALSGRVVVTGNLL